MHIMEYLEWLSKYGFIDIFFGIGVLSVVYRMFIKIVPRNLDDLSINVDFAEQNGNVLFIQIANTGGKNIYISHAYFKPRTHKFYYFRQKTIIEFTEKANFYSLNHKHYEVRFPPNLQNYDVLIKPGFVNKISTGLAINNRPDNSLIGKGRFGKLIIEYSTYGKQGHHVARV